MTGYAIKGATASTLADGVMSILGSDERLKDMSAKAFSRAREAFGIDRMVKETIDAYASTATEPAATAAW